MRKHPYLYLIPIITGAFLLLASLILLWPTTQASAQCGSQASSCKNCHETQAQDPVNNDGKDWHTAHAFGDFCYICHAGNNQSMDKATAHTGMVDPLSDIKSACQSCHPNDLQARAAVYAKELGIDLNQAGSTTPAATAAATPAGAGSTTGGQSPSSGAPSAPSGMVVDSTNVIDYTQRYNETVLGQVSINWGNVILVVLILLVALGGGAFVYYNERKLRGLPIRKTTVRSPASATPVPQIEGYSSEVAALLPMIARLNPMGLHSLKRILENPDQANTLLHSVAQLDPELIRRIRLLDRDSRELLLALAGD